MTAFEKAGSASGQTGPDSPTLTSSLCGGIVVTAGLSLVWYSWPNFLCNKDCLLRTGYIGTGVVPVPVRNSMVVHNNSKKEMHTSTFETYVPVTDGGYYTSRNYR
jgi:hypothetical protein